MWVHIWVWAYVCVREGHNLGLDVGVVRRWLSIGWVLDGCWVGVGWVLDGCWVGVVGGRGRACVRERGTESWCGCERVFIYAFVVYTL